MKGQTKNWKIFTDSKITKFTPFITWMYILWMSYQNRAAEVEHC